MTKRLMTRRLFLTALPPLAVALTACTPADAPRAIDTLAEGKIDLYESASQLEEDATVVVRVTRTDSATNTVRDEGTASSTWGYTISKVKVDEVIKNSSGQDIAVGDEIPVIENQFTYTNKSGQEVTCHINQYLMMTAGNEYYLYLRYSEDDGWYVILSGLFGKIPVAEDEELIFPASGLTLTQGQSLEDGGSESEELLRTIRQETIERYQ